MRPVLFTLTLALFAFPAAAQISAGLTGPYALVDDNGKLIGGLVELGYVTLNTPQGIGVARYDTTDGNFSSVESLFFTTADCTGQGWFPEFAIRHLGIDGGPKLVVGPVQTLYDVSDAPAPITPASRLTPVGGICAPVNLGTANFIPATEVGDLASEFTAPFHAVTVASLTAAVPIQIGWLLGGVLLGLGIKAVRKH